MPVVGESVAAGRFSGMSLSRSVVSAASARLPDKANRPSFVLESVNTSGSSGIQRSPGHASTACGAEHAVGPFHLEP